MVNVAIAGGTGAVGRTLVEVLASQDKHHAMILTRKVSAQVPQDPYFAQIQSC
jgi:NAD dependent epimerase/dehydratase family enzyme